jgi:DNA polymerase-3 subunit beta
MTATDSYRLSTAAAVYYPHATETDLHAIIPAKALAILGQACKGAKVWQGMEYIPATHVHVGADDKYVSLEVGQVCVSVRPVDGQYPNYKQLIPETFEHTFTLDRVALLDAVRSVGAMAQKNAPIRLLFADDGHGCKVWAKTQDVGESSASVPFAGTATYTPVAHAFGYPPKVAESVEPLAELDHMEIGFNPAFLADGLDTFASETIDLQVINPLRPLTIVEGEHTFLLMPVRLSS